VIFSHNFILKNIKNYTQITDAFILASNPIFYNFSQFLYPPQASQFEFKGML